MRCDCLLVLIIVNDYLGLCHCRRLYWLVLNICLLIILYRNWMLTFICKMFLTHLSVVTSIWILSMLNAFLCMVILSTWNGVWVSVFLLIILILSIILLLITKFLLALLWLSLWTNEQFLVWFELTFRVVHSFICGPPDPIISVRIFLFNILEDILDFLHMSVSCLLSFILPTGWFYFSLGILLRVSSLIWWC